MYFQFLILSSSFFHSLRNFSGNALKVHCYQYVFLPEKFIFSKFLSTKRTRRWSLARMISYVIWCQTAFGRKSNVTHLASYAWWLQRSHELLIPSCLDLKWLFKLPFVVDMKSYFTHLYLIPRWTFSLCLLRAPFIW